MAEEQLADWPRQFYQQPGGRPFLFYVVFGGSRRCRPCPTRNTAPTASSPACNCRTTIVASTQRRQSHQTDKRPYSCRPMPSAMSIFF